MNKKELTESNNAGNCQMSLTMPLAWRTQLERLAKIYSFEEDRAIAVQDLVRQAIKEKYQLLDELPEEED